MIFVPHRLLEYTRSFVYSEIKSSREWAHNYWLDPTEQEIEEYINRLTNLELIDLMGRVLDHVENTL